MLTVFLAGRGTFNYSGRKIVIKGGMVGLVRMADRGVLYSDFDDPYYHYYCRFNGHYAFFLADDIIERRGNFFSFDQVETIADNIRLMGCFHRQVLPEVMGRRELLLIQSLMLLAESNQDEGSLQLSKYAMENYLNEHIAEPTDLDSMADHFSVSKSTLCRAAKEHLDSTIQKMHERIKVDWARTLLKSGDFTVNDVASRVGFCDSMYFSRVFKKHTGLPPGKWRQTNRLR